MHERSVFAKLVSFAKGFPKHPHILAIFKVDSEYLRFPFKVKIDYFILYAIQFSLSFAKGFPKHPHILAILKVDSEYLRFPFKVKIDYFILYAILVYSFVIFLVFFAMNRRRWMFQAEQFFHSNVYTFKCKQK